MERLAKVRHKLADFHLHAANLAIKIQHLSINMCLPDKFVWCQAKQVLIEQEQCVIFFPKSWVIEASPNKSAKECLENMVFDACNLHRYIMQENSSFNSVLFFSQKAFF
jgi:hypothetical protein